MGPQQDHGLVGFAELPGVVAEIQSSQRGQRGQRGDVGDLVVTEIQHGQRGHLLERWRSGRWGRPDGSVQRPVPAEIFSRVLRGT